MLFSKLVEVFDKLRATSKRNEKIDIIAEFIKQNERDPYIQRALVYLTGKPFAKTDKRKLGLAEAGAVNIITQLALTSKEKVVESYKKTGHLGDTAEAMMKAKTQTSFMEPDPLHVETVSLEFSSVSQTAKLTGKADTIISLLRCANPSEAKYILALAMEQWPKGVGIGENIVEQAIAKATGTTPESVARAHMFTGDIAAAYVLAYRGQSSLDAQQVEFFIPFTPQLADSQGSLEEVLQKFPEFQHFDIKYDGFRVLAHKEGDTVRLFGRQLEEYTEQFPEVVEAMQKAFPGINIIIDGEIIAVHKESGRALPFQILSQRIKRKDNIAEMREKIPVKYMVFDLLYVGSMNLYDLPYYYRFSHLNVGMSLIKQDVIEVTRYIETTDKEAIQKFFAWSIENGNEGLIAKNNRLLYDFGGRNSAIKLKSVLDPLDLAIISAEWGTGKRQGVYGTFEVGCYDEDYGGYRSLGNVGTGFSDDDLKTYTELLQPLISESEGNRDYFITDPEKIIIEVAFEEIQKSPANDSGYALRFPKHKGRRVDKDADTLERVENMVKLQKRHV
jgi:DNA ligase-1